MSGLEEVKTKSQNQATESSLMKTPPPPPRPCQHPWLQTLQPAPPAPPLQNGGVWTFLEPATLPYCHSNRGLEIPVSSHSRFQFQAGAIYLIGKAKDMCLYSCCKGAWESVYYSQPPTWDVGSVSLGESL